MASKWVDCLFNALWSTGSVSRGVQKVVSQELPSRDEIKVFATFAVEVYFDQREMRQKTIETRLRSLPLVSRGASSENSSVASMKMFIASVKSVCLDAEEVAFFRADSTDTEASISIVKNRGSSRSYGYFAPKSTTILCDFRGTEMSSWSDIRTNLQVRRTKMFTDDQDCLHLTDQQKQTFKVHSGFKKSWESVKSSFVDKLVSILESFGDEEVQLAFTGHSLGGALAIVSAVDLFHDSKFSPYFSRLRVLTFGAPQTFGHSFAQYVNAQMSKNIFRVNTRHDIFPRSNMFFFHSGQNIVLAPRPVLERNVPWCVKNCSKKQIGAVQLLNPARMATTLGWIRYTLVVVLVDLLVAVLVNESNATTARGASAAVTILYVLVDVFLAVRSFRDHRMCVYWNKTERIPNNHPFVWTDSTMASIGIGCRVCSTRSASYKVSPQPVAG